MLYLSSTSDLLSINIDVAGTVTCHASYVDVNGTTVTPGRQNTNTSSSGTVTVVSSPGASTTRTVKTLIVTNTNAAVQSTVKVLHTDGTTVSEIYRTAIGPGESIQYHEGYGFSRFSAVGASLYALPDTQTPQVPAQSTLNAFAKSLAGRMMLAQIGPSGIDTTFQPNLGGNKVALWMPPGNATTVPGVFGMAALTATGTATARTVATTSTLTRMTRLGYVSAATAGSLSGAREAAAKYSVGAGAGLGGFFARYRFAASDAASVSGARMFVGLSASTAAPTNVEPSTLVNCVGVAQLSSSVNMQIVFGGAVARTPINLGTDFPAWASTPVPYELILFSPPSGGVYYQVTRLNTQYSASGFLSSGDVPSPTTLLCHQLWRTNNATALAVGIDICGIYIETDI